MVTGFLDAEEPSQSSWPACKRDTDRTLLQDGPVKLQPNLPASTWTCLMEASYESTRQPMAVMN